MIDNSLELSFSAALAVSESFFLELVLNLDLDKSFPPEQGFSLCFFPVLSTLDILEVGTPEPEATGYLMFDFSFTSARA